MYPIPLGVDRPLFAPSEQINSTQHGRHSAGSDASCRYQFCSSLFTFMICNFCELLLRLTYEAVKSSSKYAHDIERSTSCCFFVLVLFVSILLFCTVPRSTRTKHSPLYGIVVSYDDHYQWAVQRGATVNNNCFSPYSRCLVNSSKCARCRVLDNHFTAHLLQNLSVKQFWKSVKIWQNYGHEFGVQFVLAHPVIIIHHWCWYFFCTVSQLFTAQETDTPSTQPTFQWFSFSKSTALSLGLHQSRSNFSYVTVPVAFHSSD